MEDRSGEIGNLPPQQPLAKFIGAGSSGDPDWAANATSRPFPALSEAQVREELELMAEQHRTDSTEIQRLEALVVEIETARRSLKSMLEAIDDTHRTRITELETEIADLRVQLPPGKIRAWAEQERNQAVVDYYNLPEGHPDGRYHRGRRDAMVMLLANLSEGTWG